MKAFGPERLRNLASVNSVLTTAAASPLLERFGRAASVAGDLATRELDLVVAEAGFARPARRRC